MDVIKAIVILSIDGKRIISKYFDEKLTSNDFEKQIYNKTKNHKKRDDIFVLDSCLVLHQHLTDLHIYVAGSRGENPLILEKVLHCLVEVISSLLNKSVEHQSIMENMDQVILALDEISDGGIVLETNPDLVLQRVNLKEDVYEQSMARVLQSATEHIKFPWIRS